MRTEDIECGKVQVQSGLHEWAEDLSKKAHKACTPAFIHTHAYALEAGAND